MPFDWSTDSSNEGGNCERRVKNFSRPLTLNRTSSVVMNRSFLWQPHAPVLFLVRAHSCPCCYQEQGQLLNATSDIVTPHCQTGAKHLAHRFFLGMWSMCRHTIIILWMCRLKANICFDKVLSGKLCHVHVRQWHQNRGYRRWITEHVHKLWAVVNRSLDTSVGAVSRTIKHPVHAGTGLLWISQFQGKKGFLSPAF